MNQQHPPSQFKGYGEHLRAIRLPFHPIAVDMHGPSGCLPVLVPPGSPLLFAANDDEITDPPPGEVETNERNTESEPEPPEAVRGVQDEPRPDVARDSGILVFPGRHRVDLDR